MKSKEVDYLKDRSSKLRLHCLEIANHAGDKAAHIGGALSCIDFIVTADYLWKFSSSKENLKSFILSKGHACLSLYALLADSGIIDLQSIKNTFELDGSKFLGHPCRNEDLGIVFSTGSLGNGMAHAAGMALENRLSNRNKSSPTICIVGDGECNEGIVWETFEFISNKNISNMIVFIDCNGWQQTQPSLYASDKYRSLYQRLNTYNFDLHFVDGNDHNALLSVLNKQEEKAKVILGITKKGKGFDLFEDNNDWHHGILTDHQYQNLINNIT